MDKKNRRVSLYTLLSFDISIYKMIDKVKKKTKIKSKRISSNKRLCSFGSSFRVVILLEKKSLSFGSS